MHLWKLSESGFFCDRTRGGGPGTLFSLNLSAPDATKKTVFTDSAQKCIIELLERVKRSTAIAQAVGHHFPKGGDVHAYYYNITRVGSHHHG